MCSGIAIYEKKAYFLKISSFLQKDFDNISKPQLQKIFFLQILTAFMIVAFVWLYFCLANNYVDFTQTKSTYRFLRIH